MNKTLKLSLVAFAIIAGTLLLMAGAGTGPRYVGRFFGDGTGLSNSVDLVEGPNILITPGPGNRAYTIESTAAGSAGIFTNSIMGYGDEYRTNYVRISPLGVTVNSGALISDRLVVLGAAASNHIAGDMTLVGDMTIGGSNYVAGDMGVFGTLFVDGVSASGTIFTSDIFEGNGSGITNLSGDEIRSGTVADARIASTIARDSEVTTATQNSTNAGNIVFKPANNVFTGSNYFTAPVVVNTNLIVNAGGNLTALGSSNRVNNLYSDTVTVTTLGAENFYPTNINAWYIGNTNGAGGLPIPTNAPANGAMIVGTSASTAAWKPIIYPITGYGPQGAGAFPRYEALSGGLNSGTETNGYGPMPVGGYITNFYVQFTPTTAAGTNMTFTIKTNGTATPVAVTIAGLASSGNSGSTACASLPIGTPIAIEVSCPTNHGMTLYTKWSLQIVAP